MQKVSSERVVSERRDEFARRLLGVFLRAEAALGPDETLLAALGSAVNFSLRRFPEAELIGLLRETADRLEAARQSAPPTVN